jgi:hypothetical protein
LGDPNVIIKQTTFIDGSFPKENDVKVFLKSYSLGLHFHKQTLNPKTISLNKDILKIN